MSSIDPAIAGVIDAKAAAARTQAGFAVQAKALNVTKEQGEAAVQLLEAAASLSKSLSTGKTFDAQG